MGHVEPVSIRADIRTGPCVGFRVIEIGTMVTAPLCAQILGDLGADVVKIEPIGGEIMRVIPPVFRGHSAAFAQWNRNKRSLAVNLKSDEGVEIVRRLATKADAFVQNMRAGVAAKLGLGYDILSGLNPNLVYLELTGYGPDGPYRDMPGYDMIVQGLTGFMPIQGNGGRPEPVRAIQADKVTAYSAALAILAALLHRSKGGSGQHIDTNLLDAYATFMLPEVLYGKSFPEAPPNNASVMNIYNTIKVVDGEIIGFIMTDDQFEAACELWGLEEVRGDERFRTPASRNVHQAELMTILGTHCSHLTAAEVVEKARAVGIPFAPINDIDAFMRDDQALHNETFVEFEAPVVGPVRLVNGFARFSDTPINARSLAPTLGKHTDEILESLGFSGAEVAEFRSRGIVG